MLIASTLIWPWTYFYATTMDVIAQFGLLVIALAFLLMFLCVAYKVCENTIKDDDIVATLDDKRK